MLDVCSRALHCGGKPSKDPVILLKPTWKLCLTMVGAEISIVAAFSEDVDDVFLFFLPNGILSSNMRPEDIQNKATYFTINKTKYCAAIHVIINIVPLNIRELTYM